MPISQKPTENIPKEVWNVYQILMEIAFGNEDASKAAKFYTKDAFMIGTAEKELVIGHQALINFFDTQQKSSAEVHLKYRRFPVKSWHPTKSTFCITDEYDMILEKEVVFRMRLTCVFVKDGKKWLCDHIHSSVPDRDVPEDEFWPIEELKHQNQILAEKINERTRELEIEAALERVRARAFAMQDSSEIMEVNRVLREELESLGQAALQTTNVHLYHLENREIETWGAFRKVDNINDDITYNRRIIPFNKSKLIQRVIRAYRSKKKTEYTIIASHEELKEWYKMREKIMPEAQQLGPPPKKMYFRFSNFRGGSLIMGAEKPPSLETKNLQKKAASIFDVAYQRYLDLKKAELQTREAQIEAALERVRASAMAMRNSDDLADTIRIFYDQIGLLDENPRRCGIDLIDKKTKSVYISSMNTDEKGNSIEAIGSMKLQGHWVLEGIYKSWIKQKEYFPVLKQDEIKQYYDFVRPYVGYPDYQKDEVHYGHFFSFNEGCIYVWTTKQMAEEELKIYRRFTSVLSLTYKRYHDLKKAESQTREAQIEAAVERVRTQAMAMHQPDDIVKVNETMLKEIADLGIKNLTGAAIILFDKNDILTMWDISDPGNMGNVRDNKSIYDPRDFAVLGDFWRRWKKGENYFVIEYDFQTVNTALEEWKKVDYENYLSLKRAIDEDKLKTQWNPFASFSRGLLTLDLMEKPNEDTEKIMTKMANTFDLAYQRFDDLQKAAEQAQEARKQASLDRIRAEIASMRNQRDLEKLTPFIWMELSTLGISFFRCGIFIMDEQSSSISMYLSTPMGESIATVSLDFDNSPITKAASDHWKAQEIFREQWNKDQFMEWSEGLVSQGLVVSAKSYQHADNPPEKLCLQFVPFKQGMLYVGTADFLIENDLELIKDVADTFSIAYTRYEDFVQLERAKHMAEDALGELRSTQSQLIHAEKMASLGELTAGIAHEIQNPLNFVNNFSDLNKELVDELNEALETGDLDEAKAILQDLQSNEDKIIHHGKRAEGIVKGMLQHSRSGDGQKELTDLNQLADEFLRLSYHGLRAKDKSFNAEFTSSLDPQIPKIHVIPQDIGRVLLNLINNAFHATSEKKTSNPSYKAVVEVITRKEESYVKIIVKDNGPGIPDKLKEKIFQPFFTTKATGTGTGLGLSMSHDIISKGHGGTIEVESEVGKGTTFIIKLPLHLS